MIQKKAESGKWLTKGSGGPHEYSTVISTGGSKIAINWCLQTYFLNVLIKNTAFRATNFPERSVLAGEALVWLCLCTGSSGVRAGNGTGEQAVQLAHSSLSSVQGGDKSSRASGIRDACQTLKNI